MNRISIFKKLNELQRVEKIAHSVELQGEDPSDDGIDIIALKVNVGWIQK